MKGFIYKITNKVNGKSYIGQTRYSVEFRYRQHLRKTSPAMAYDIKKYGVEAFECETLEECDYKDLDSREIYYIDKYNTFYEGYNRQRGGKNREYAQVVTDDKYDEIVGLYKSGFSVNKIGELYGVDKSVIGRILTTLGVKLKDPKRIKINHQEFLELVRDYETGYSLRELAKRYNCTAVGLKEYLQKKGVDIKKKYSIMDDEEGQLKLIDDYLGDQLTLKEIMQKHHCQYNTLTKILSLHNIKIGKPFYKFKLSEKQCLEAIKLFNGGLKVSEIAKKFEVDRGTIYTVFKRYGVNYLTV